MSWTRFKQNYLHLNELDFALDISRIDFDDTFLTAMEPKMQAAYQAMQALEGGAIANPDEGRMVGHYWLRAPQLAPDAAIRTEIETCLDSIQRIAADVHSGALRGAAGAFKNLLVIGIGGSALGPRVLQCSPRQPVPP